VIKIYYSNLNPNKIFGSVGRCGGGYNTVWEDWSDHGRLARESITRQYEEGLDKICGHYTKLEKSILTEGFRNPLIVTRGQPTKRKLSQLPPEILSLPSKERYILEGVTGGSRLWVAQKHNIPVPCIINDNSNAESTGELITSVDQARNLFKDPPKTMWFDSKAGLVEAYDNHKTSYHLEPELIEDDIVKYRAPLWVSLMNSHGYYVARLQPFIEHILKDAGVVQPDYLKR
jgi:hypothetical protein